MAREVIGGICSCALVCIGAWAFAMGGWAVVGAGCTGVLALSVLDGWRRG